ncbi:hypothetical protein V6615_11895 [Oscillospiraceae bacterium PP1C4]
MDNIFVWLLLAIGLPILFYILWIKGYLVVNTKRAILFVGSLRKKSRCKIRFLSCSGVAKKVLNFSEVRSYTFNLDSKITKGNVSIEILNKHKDIKLELKPSVTTGTLFVEEKEMYYLIFKFDKADGEYELTWY